MAEGAYQAVALNPPNPDTLERVAQAHAKALKAKAQANKLGAKAWGVTE